MARYLVQIPRDTLLDERKARIAGAITRANSEMTGEPAEQTEVAIAEIDAGCFFSGGQLLECGHIFVHGFLAEGGRSRDEINLLVARLSRDVAAVTDFESDSVWTSITTT